MNARPLRMQSRSTIQKYAAPWLSALALALGSPALAGAGGERLARAIVVASTTSIEHSGLFAHILPLFKARTGIEVKVIAQGSGQALDIGRRGDADLVFVHAEADEIAFVEGGYGVARVPVMSNHHVIVGPKADPAGIASSRDASDALRKIAAAQARFASRGDRSGTHMAELKLWHEAGIDPKGQGWYRELGSGMGPTLNVSAQLMAYTLTDRGTWLGFKNRSDLVVLVEGDARLHNSYSVILVNPARHPAVRAREGQAFIDWLTSAEGQAAIASYSINGEQPFLPVSTTAF